MSHYFVDIKTGICVFWWKGGIPDALKAFFDHFGNNRPKVRYYRADSVLGYDARYVDDYDFMGIID